MIKRYVDFLQETTYGLEYEDGSDMSEDATAFLEYVAMLWYMAMLGYMAMLKLKDLLHYRVMNGLMVWRIQKKAVLAGSCLSAVIPMGPVPMASKIWPAMCGNGWRTGPIQLKRPK